MHLPSILENFRPHDPGPLMDLPEARIQLHHAIVSLASPLEPFVSRKADDSQGSFFWDFETQALLTHTILSAEGPFRLGFRFYPAEVLILPQEKQKSPLFFALEGATLEGLKNWIRERFQESGLSADSIEFKTGGALFPHPVIEGKPFHWNGKEKSLLELEKYYSNAALILEEVRKEEGSGAVWCWPHHFDIATLFERKTPSATQSIGIGLSPGDKYYELPYYYITPYPHAKELKPPPLPFGGNWHTQDWLGGVLGAEAISKEAKKENQLKGVANFIAAAVEASKKIIPQT